VAALEFIEPEELWSDPDAVEEYAETLDDGIPVTVIVPDDERLEAEAMLREEVGWKVRVLSYNRAPRRMALSPNALRANECSTSDIVLFRGIFLSPSVFFRRHERRLDRDLPTPWAL
jgi:hypothetical protein